MKTRYLPLLTILMLLAVFVLSSCRGKPTAAPTPDVQQTEAAQATLNAPAPTFTSEPPKPPEPTPTSPPPPTEKQPEPPKLEPSPTIAPPALDAPAPKSVPEESAAQPTPAAPEVVQTPAAPPVQPFPAMAADSYQVVYTDDFTNKRVWPVQNADDFSTGYGDGGYRIYSNFPYDAAWAIREQSYTDVRLEVDVARLSGPRTGYYGVVCRFQDGSNYYGLFIAGDGTYGIFKKVNGKAGFIQYDYNPTRLIAVNNSSTHVRGDCVGDTLSLYANGEKLMSVQDTDLVAGSVGLAAGNQRDTGIQAVFKNYAVYLPATQPSAMITVPEQPAVGPVVIPDANFQVVYQDDFSSRAGGWPAQQEDDFSTRFYQGGYLIYANFPYDAAWAIHEQSLVDTRVEVDVSRVSGPRSSYYGVICRFQDGSNYYGMFIAGDGTYGIFKKVNGKAGFIQYNSQPTPIIAVNNSPNRVRGDCIGNTLALYANGQFLMAVQDNDLVAGSAGLAAGNQRTTGVEALFKNFVELTPR